MLDAGEGGGGISGLNVELLGGGGGSGGFTSTLGSGLSSLSLRDVRILNRQVSFSDQAALISWPTLGTPSEILNPIAPTL